MEVFCGFFTGNPPVKNPLAGQTSDLHASCGKISMVNFQKENNVIAHIRETLQLYENLTLSNYSPVMYSSLSEV